MNKKSFFIQRYRRFIKSLEHQINDDLRNLENFFSLPKIHTIGFSLFPKCNLKCDYCFAKSYRTDELVANYEKIFLNSITSFKKTYHHFNFAETGIHLQILPIGEPLLFQDNLILLIDTLLDLKIKIKEVSITTNGTLLLSDKFAKKLNEVVEKYLAVINFVISFDGNDEITFRHRGVSLETILRFIKDIRTKVNRFEISFHHTWTKDWLTKEQEIVRFLTKNFANYQHDISHITPLKDKDLFYESLINLIFWSKLFGLKIYYKPVIIGSCPIIQNFILNYPYVTGCISYSPYFDSVLLREGLSLDDVKALREELVHAYYLKKNQKVFLLKKRVNYYKNRKSKLDAKKDFPEQCINCMFFNICFAKYCPIFRLMSKDKKCALVEKVHAKFYEQFNFEEGNYPILSKINGNTILIGGFYLDLKSRKKQLLAKKINCLFFDCVNNDSVSQLKATLLQRKEKKSVDPLWIYIRNVLDLTPEKIKEFVLLMTKWNVKKIPIYLFLPDFFSIDTSLLNSIKEYNIFFVLKDNSFFLKTNKSLFSNEEHEP